MRFAAFFIAVILDGYIADTNGNADWLHLENPTADDMDSCREFIRDLKAIC